MGKGSRRRSENSEVVRRNWDAVFGRVESYHKSNNCQQCIEESQMSELVLDCKKCHKNEGLS